MKTFKLYLKLTLLFTVIFLGGYFAAVQNMKIENQNEAVAITARMIFAQQCSEHFEIAFGTSHSTTRMSKEQMQANMLCYELADKISTHISQAKELITEDNVVQIVDNAIGQMKNDIKNNQNEPESTEECVEEVDASQFI
jgi:tRNA G46 methylase TrmB